MDGKSDERIDRRRDEIRDQKIGVCNVEIIG